MIRIALFLFLVAICSVCAAQQVKEADVPVGVRTIASEQSNNQPITMWVLDKKRGKYIATVISTTAVQGIEISLDGKWIETTSGVPPDKMPQPVLKTAKEGFPAYELDNYFYITSPGKSPYYTVDASSDDEDLTLSIDGKGKILEKKTR